ncbi:hypothetical protein F4821DRAFT_228832 [Hypoxylon rubiginosum]|uniref:Uncharacterized protein n=1 Tax=Hypoxylon rubiginosum TaxID=110542 RepID=A0ACC0DDG1_9PEZI|nr:hypothetical protein F4821DRAFT_228832 [Hypoxylon rubiginosum]
MYLLRTVIVAAGLIAGAASTNQNLGCNNCLGVSADRINYGCRQDCSSAFNSASSEYEVCYDTCQHFAFTKHCCTGSCSGDANTCMNRFLPPENKKRSVFPSASEDRNHARDFTPVEPQYGAIMVRDDRTGLVEARVDVGASCCKAAQAILAASVTKVVPLLQGQVWNEDALAGLILIGFGLSAATACSKVFSVSCLFTAPGVQGNVAGGPLPGGNLA